MHTLEEWARLQRILETSRTCLVGEADALIDEARTILASRPTPGPVYEGDIQFNATGSWDMDYGPTGYGVDAFQLRISEEVREIEEAVRKEGFSTPDTLVIRVTDDITLVFAPVAHQTHTIIDDDGAPVDYVKEGEPFMDGEGTVDYGIDGRWLSVLTPTKTVRGKEAETILENLMPGDSPIPISRLDRGRSPRQFYRSAMGYIPIIPTGWAEAYGQE